MNDWGRSVLSQYDIEVKSVKKIRGALLCETSQGLKLLQRYIGSEKRLQAEAYLLNQMYQQGMRGLDRYLPNAEGNLCAKNEYQEQFVMKEWFEGEECGVFDTKKLMAGMARLGELHLHLKEMKASDSDSAPDWKEYIGSSLLEEMEKHNRELRKIRTYIKDRRRKTQFETCVLESFSFAYEQAERAVECLKGSEYNALYQKAIEKASIIHGDYNYHNLIWTSEGCAIVNFSKFSVQLQIKDLYDYLRKIMEKYSWDVDLGTQLIEEYHRRMPMSEEERNILACMLLYPEKYWKQLNFFYNGNKAWISAKSIEKLSRAALQCQEREDFIQRGLGINL